MRRKKWVEEDESRFKRGLSAIGKMLEETQTILNNLREELEPLEYERALRILWGSMAANDRRSLIRALIAFYDEYVELREGASLDDVDQLMTKWFGEGGPRADICKTWGDDLKKAWEDDLSAMENLVKKARHFRVTVPDQTEIKTKEKTNDEGRG